MASQEAQDIERARRAYVAAMGTPKETVMRKRLEWAVEAARKVSK